MRLGRAHARFAALALVAGMAIGGCGENDPAPDAPTPAITGAAETPVDGDDGGPSDGQPTAGPAADRRGIARTLTRLLAGDDAAQSCRELVTERYLRRSYGDRSGCVAAQRGQEPAADVELSGIVILPDSLAQARAVPTGGIYDGERLRADLVLDGGTWRVDSLRSNVPVGP